MRRSVFFRILISCLVPLIAVFSVVIATINRIVYDQNVKLADDRATSFAAETTRQINDGHTNVRGLLELMSNNLLSINPSDPNAVEMASTLAKSTLTATPYIYCVWFSFEPDGFIAEERFSRDFVKDGDQIVELPNLSDDILDDPDLAPWYVIPFTTGETHFESADYYDYEMGLGSQYTDTLSTPLIRDGKTIGVVGIDTLYRDTFRFIDEKQIEGEQKLLLLTQDGEIVYSTDSAYLRQSIFNLSFENKSQLQESLARDESFWIEGASPFLGVHSRMYFSPVYNTLASKQLYLYVDLSTDALFSSAENATQTIVGTSILGLILLTLTLFFTTRNILKPIKSLTESANMIADGHLDVNLDSELIELHDIDQSKNEIAILFVALQKMLNQLNQVQELKLEAIEARYEKEKAEASTRSKSDFLARMSHEIRTPMNAIIGMTELALREDIPLAAYEHILAIKQSGANLLSIINDILDFSKIESGKLEIVNGDYLFASLINDVINIIRTRAMDSHLRFVANIDSRIPNAMIGDEIRIRQVMLNLLSNAVKYTEEGFVSLTAACEMTDEQTVMLTIEVTDSGRGIKEEDMNKLFGDFVQIDLMKNKGIEGTGLGLAITRSFVRAMGGDITVRSEYGKGSTFTVTLSQGFHQYERLASVENPEEKSILVYERRETYAKSIEYTVKNLGVGCTLVTAEEAFYDAMAKGIFTFVFVSSFLLKHAKRAIAQLGSAAKVVLLTEYGEAIAEGHLSILTMPVHPISVANILNGVSDSYAYGEQKADAVRFVAPSAKVLVVDDVNTNLKVAEGLMLPYHMQIDLCKSGKDAINAMRSNRYDLVLMDHMMPEMDGVEATKRIRALDDPNSKSVPIVALTANAVTGAREMFLQSGFDDFLSKPIDTSKLNAVLKKWIPKEKQTKSKEETVVNTTQKVTISGMDTARGIAMTGGKVETYLKTLAVFHKDGLEKINEIRACLETDNLPLYTTFVHALKSVLASIGAGELSDTAKALELAGKQEDLSYISEHTDRFLTDLVALLANIYEALPAAAKEEQPVLADLEMMKSELTQLKAALESFDSEAIDSAVERLQAYTALQDFGPVVEEILQNTLIGEYDEAISSIDTITAQLT